jgi:hypothetical protein
MRRLILFAALAAIAGCIRDPDPIALDEFAVSVDAVLEAGVDSAVVFIGRPAPGGFSGRDSYRAVSGAEVALVLGSDTTWLAEDPSAPCVQGASDGDDAGRGCYRAHLAGSIQPGATYGLEITLPDGSRVTGSTVVPHPGEVLSPAPGHRVVARCASEDVCWPAPPDYAPVALLDLEWRNGEGVEAVLLHMEAVDVFYRGGTYPGSDCTLGFNVPGGFLGVLRSEKTLWSVPAVQCHGEATANSRFDSIRARVRVVGVDAAYASYAEALWEGSTIRDASASAGLTGAFGVFGSAAVAAAEIMLIRDPAPPPPDPGIAATP